MSGRTGWVLDVAKLATVLDAMRQLLGLSQRQLAGQLGVGPNTITRLNQGGAPDADALASIFTWLNTDIRQYTTKRETT